MDSIKPLRDFVLDLTRAVEKFGQDEPAMLREGKKLLARLIVRDDWLPPEFAQVHADTYRQYLLYCDPLERFSVVSFVWAFWSQYAGARPYGLGTGRRAARIRKMRGNTSARATHRRCARPASISSNPAASMRSPHCGRHPHGIECAQRPAGGQHPCLRRQHRRCEAPCLCARNRRNQTLRFGLFQQHDPESLGPVRGNARKYVHIELTPEPMPAARSCDLIGLCPFLNTPKEDFMTHTYEELKHKPLTELREIAAGITHEAVQGYAAEQGPSAGRAVHRARHRDESPPRSEGHRQGSRQRQDQGMEGQARRGAGGARPARR